MSRGLRTPLAAFAGMLILQGVAAQTTVVVPAQTDTRTSAYTYVPAGHVKTAVTEPSGGADLKLTNTYTYDPVAKGNRTQAKLSGWNGTSIEDRVAKTGYDANGRFPTTITNALNQVQSLEYDLRFGTVTKSTDANGLTTQWSYDEFGRKTEERRGYASAAATIYVSRTEWKYERCADVTCASVQGRAPAMVVSAFTKSFAGDKIAPTIKVYRDALDREVRTETEAVTNGVVKPVYRDTAYNSRGLVEKASLPYFFDATPVWASQTYDDKNRKVSEFAPNGIQTIYQYSGVRVTATVKATEGERSQTTVRDGAGRIVEVIDPDARSTNFAHDGFGNLTHSVDPYGNVITLGYDALGRKRTMGDPDLGNLVYAYNAFGESIRQTDARGKTATLVYDAVGRLKTRSEPDLNSYFEYDTASQGVGQLAKTWTDNGYCRVHGYDGLGRASSASVRVGTGASACTTASEVYTTSTSYDDTKGGRVDVATYPTGVKIQQLYNASLGFLEKIQNVTGGGAAVYWQRTEGDAAGRTTGYSQGNAIATLRSYDPQTDWLKTIVAGTGGNAALGNVQVSAYNYDSTGHLNQRADKFDIPNLVEKFKIDPLGRLTESALYDSAAVNEIAGSRNTLTYDDIGNIKTKSGVGSYYYNASGAGSVRPHAATAVRGALNNDYAYDTSGNMLSGAGRSLSYTSFGMPRMAGSGSTCHEFLFQGEHMRLQQTIYNAACRTAGNGEPDNAGSPVASRTLYLHPNAANGLGFEREIRGAITTYKHFVTAGSVVVGVLETSTMGVTSASTGSIKYFHYDHLGSVVAVSDAAGSVVERRSFDPWGRARSLNGAAGTGELPGGLAAATDRGFTLHEHLEGLGLVHMNARVYDPQLARFTSADPIVQQPYDAQTFNRYSYVQNRPLDLVDPTGMTALGQLDTVTVTGESGWRNVTYLSPFGFGSTMPISFTSITANGAVGASGAQMGNGGNGLKAGCVSAGGCPRGFTWESENDAVWYGLLQEAGTQADGTAATGTEPAGSGLTLSGAAHGLLGAGSFAPSLIGSVASGLDGLLHLAEGNKTEAAIAGAGALAGLVTDAGAARLLLKGGKELAAKGAAEGEKLLFRRGAADTKALLQRDAQAAENALGIHGVSVSTNPAAKAGQVVRCATCSSVEAAGFKVQQTGGNPAHHTVELPKPITPDVVRTWNELFK